MARRALTVCSCTGCAAHPASCPELVPTGRCSDCRGVVERQRGTRQQRGYGAEHDRLRERWRPEVEAGRVDCARCGRGIGRDQLWHLDHTDDRSGYLGPSHEACNTSAGGRAAHQT